MDKGPVARPQEGRDRAGVEETTTDVDFSSQLPQELVELRQVVRIGVRHHVYVLGGSDVSPGVDGQAADEDETDLCFNQPLEELAQAQRSRAQLRFALPVKVERNSLSAKPSARLTAKGRLPSSRSWRRRASSLARQGSSRRGCG